MRKSVKVVVFAFIIYMIFYTWRGNSDPNPIRAHESQSINTAKKIVQPSSIQNYPCFKDSLPTIQKHEEYYNISLSTITPMMDDFSRLVDNAYLLNIYREFLLFFRDFLNKNQLTNHNNPKFNFLFAIEYLSSGELDSARHYLHEFLTIRQSYQADKDKYFSAGCDQYDVEWLEQPEAYLPYQYAELIYTYLEDIDSSSGLDKSAFHTLAKKVLEIDNTPQDTDLGENIYYILRELSGNVHDDYKTLLKEGRRILTSDLNIFKDQREYFLVSQIELVALAKLNQAKDIYNRIIWNEDIKERLWLRHITSLFRFYELNLTLLGVADGELLARLSSVAGDYEEESQIASLVEFYNDLLLPKPLLPQTRMYKNLQMKILQEDFESISEIVSNLNEKYYSPNSVSILDSVLHFVFQKELIDYGILLTFPKYKDKDNYLPHLDKKYLERFRLLSKGGGFSFLEGKGVFPRLCSWFYSGYDRNTLKTMLEYLNPGSSVNHDNKPVLDSFSDFKIILEPPGEIIVHH